MCTLVFKPEDPCVHFFCPSLCQWSIQTCSSYELFPASLQCPAANCTVQPTPPTPEPPSYNVIWIGISTTVAVLFLRKNLMFCIQAISTYLFYLYYPVVLGSVCCSRCCRRSSQQRAAEGQQQEQQEEQRPLLQRLRFRQRLGQRASPRIDVELHDLSQILQDETVRPIIRGTGTLSRPHQPGQRHARPNAPPPTPTEGCGLEV